MSLKKFLKHFLYHIVMSAVVVCGLLVAAEWFVPGSILPFMNLVGAVLICTLCVFAASFILSQKEK